MIKRVFLVVLSLVFVLQCFPVFVIAQTSFFSEFDGKTYIKPEAADGVLFIRTASELAWVLKKQNILDCTTIALLNNIDLNGYTLKPFPSKLQLFEGNNYTIREWSVDGGGAFVPSSSISLCVQNVVFEELFVNKNVAGGMVGTLKGNASFNNCHIRNSSIVASDFGGGMVGQIVRPSKTNRATRISATFSKSGRYYISP